MALIHGAATMAPIQLSVLRTKLLMATPEELRLRISSVSMVVATDWKNPLASEPERGGYYLTKTSMDEIPKKNRARHGTTGCKP